MLASIGSALSDDQTLADDLLRSTTNVLGELFLGVVGGPLLGVGLISPVAGFLSALSLMVGWIVPA